MSGPSARVTERAWFDRPVLEVAADLLGAVLRVVRGDGVVAVRLTEVEAYGGADDPGSHAFRGRSARNAVMFGEPGHLYVYRHLGLHRCVNVVTGPAGQASAVLLRAGQVVEGVDAATARRSAEGVVRREVDLARGPARLAVALGLVLADDGSDLLGKGIELAPTRVTGFRSGPRVGVAGPGGDPERFPWRLWVPDDPTVSAFRPGVRRRRTPDG
ncbi:DNA-3-methyladenine glycosylase [Actinotalea sp. M2MS4P-6]|uniref:DNA-3-methyladenine glycosylase n=1 Tax=Actinotalea sp. M2MS4P-6 TaxID=2983762 RepID=UPI0021E3E134|nr:DNA-3-methyladenine glycosylase [Actinotalea sp. M2MS4P-6]MCV2393373.1 DNA-3-methyladenine glycosylase [Actinotalea sp. M2MS4P-6]